MRKNSPRRLKQAVYRDTEYGDSKVHLVEAVYKCASVRFPLVIERPADYYREAAGRRGGYLIDVFDNSKAHCPRARGSVNVRREVHYT